MYVSATYLFPMPSLLSPMDQSMFYGQSISSLWRHLADQAPWHIAGISDTAFRAGQTSFILNTLQWRRNERDGVSNHQPHDYLLNRLFRRRSKKTSKFRVTALCEGNSPMTGGFPAQKASNARNVSIWWRHHDIDFRIKWLTICWRHFQFHFREGKLFLFWLSFHKALLAQLTINQYLSM